MFNTGFSRILYCIPPGTAHLKPDLIQAFKEECEEIEVIEGLPDVDLNSLNSNNEHKLVLSIFSHTLQQLLLCLIILS